MDPAAEAWKRKKMSARCKKVGKGGVTQKNQQKQLQGGKTQFHKLGRHKTTYICL